MEKDDSCSLAFAFIKHLKALSDQRLMANIIRVLKSHIRICDRINFYLDLSSIKTIG